MVSQRMKPLETSHRRGFFFASGCISKKGVRVKVRVKEMVLFLSPRPIKFSLSLLAFYFPFLGTDVAFFHLAHGLTPFWGLLDTQLECWKAYVSLSQSAATAGISYSRTRTHTYRAA